MRCLVFESEARISNSYGGHLSFPGRTNDVMKDSLLSQDHHTTWGAQFLPTHPITSVNPKYPPHFEVLPKHSSSFSFYYGVYLLRKLWQKRHLLFMLSGTEKWVKNHLHSRKNETASLFESIKIKKQPKSNHIKPSSLH